MSNPTGDAQNGKQVSPPPYTPVDGCHAELDGCRAAFEAAIRERFPSTQFERLPNGYYADNTQHGAWMGWQAALEWQARATTKGQDGVVSAEVVKSFLELFEGFPGVSADAQDFVLWMREVRPVIANAEFALAALQEAKGQGGSDE